MEHGVCASALEDAVGGRFEKLRRRTSKLLERGYIADHIGDREFLSVLVIYIYIG